MIEITHGSRLALTEIVNQQVLEYTASDLISLITEYASWITNYTQPGQVIYCQTGHTADTVAAGIAAWWTRRMFVCFELDLGHQLVDDWASTLASPDRAGEPVRPLRARRGTGFRVDSIRLESGDLPVMIWDLKGCLGRPSWAVYTRDAMLCNSSVVQSLISQEEHASLVFPLSNFTSWCSGVLPALATGSNLVLHQPTPQHWSNILDYYPPKSLILPHVAVRSLRDQEFSGPVVMCGGVPEASECKILWEAGADCIYNWWGATESGGPILLSTASNGGVPECFDQVINGANIKFFDKSVIVTNPGAMAGVWPLNDTRENHTIQDQFVRETQGWKWVARHNGIAKLGPHKINLENFDQLLINHCPGVNSSSSTLLRRSGVGDYISTEIQGSTSEAEIKNWLQGWGLSRRMLPLKWEIKHENTGIPTRSLV